MSTSDLNHASDTGVPDTALIERLVNELFTSGSGSLSGYPPSASLPGGLTSALPDSFPLSLGSTRPTQDLNLPLTGADPLDLHLTPRSSPEIPDGFGCHEFKGGNGSGNLPAQGTEIPEEALLRELLKENAAEHPRMTGTTLYFLDNASNPKPAQTSPEKDAPPQIITSGHPAFDVMAVRRDFPILRELVNGRPLACWIMPRPRRSLSR